MSMIMNVYGLYVDDRHYLFDPTKDLLYDTFGNSGHNGMGASRASALAKLFLTTNPRDNGSLETGANSVH